MESGGLVSDKKRRGVSHQNDKIEILYRSSNYLAVNKGFDIKINSNLREEMTVEQQLRHMLPELVDPKCFHAFRFIILFIRFSFF